MNELTVMKALQRKKQLHKEIDQLWNRLTSQQKQSLDEAVSEGDISSVEFLKLLKAQTGTLSWHDLSAEEQAGIRRGQEDIKAGRSYTSEEFWQKIKERTGFHPNE